MGQGNLNKVDAIVDEIVKNNSIFKLKSLIEQDREKDSMVRSINNALSGLNEIGKELVLQDLSVDPDEKFKGFIDNAGNIDISGIIKFTATIVKGKIEEAEREGINLRKDAPTIFKNEKIQLEDSVLTIAMLDVMVNNFKDLSEEERQDVINNWTKLNKKQQAEVMGSYADMIREGSEKLKSESDRKLSEQFSKKLKRDSEELKSEKTDDFSKEKQKEEKSKHYIEYIQQKYPSLYREFLQYMKEKKVSIYGKDSLEIFDEFESFRRQKNVILAEKMKEEQERIERTEQTVFSTELQKNIEQIITIDSERDIIMDIATIEISNDSKENENKKVASNGENIQGESVAISKANKEIFQKFSEVSSKIISKEFLNTYSDTLKSFDREIIVELNKIKNLQERYSVLLDFFVEDGIPQKIAEILSKIDYNGQLFNILGDSTKREQFFEQLDQLIEQTKEPQLTDANIQQGIENITLREEEIIVATEQERATQESQEVEQEDYSFINAKYLEQDSIEGLIPRNGGNSKAIQDDKTAIFYSQGKEGAIVMYFEFLRQYENLRGERGDKALQKYEAYQNGSLQLNEKEIVQLEAQIEQIKDIRNAQTFDEFMGDKLYLKIDGLDRQEDKKKADEWRAANKGTKMNYNYANSWTEDAIPPDKIDVVTLQRNDGTDTKVSQKDIITYFMSQTSVEKIAELGINDTTLGLIQDYYEEHSLEISEFGTEYSLVNQDIKEFVQSRENKMQTYEFVERNEHEEQEDVTGNTETSKEAELHYIQDFLKFNKSGRTSLEEVREQNDLIISIANEKINAQEKVAEEAENEEKMQDDF